MNFSKILTIAAAFMLMAIPAHSYADGPKKMNKKALATENVRLQSKIDSLHKEISKFAKQIQKADSSYADLKKAYEASTKHKPFTVTVPQNYTIETSDSLLDMWYVHNQVKQYDFDVNISKEHLQTDIPDSVFIQRLKDMNVSFSLPYNEIVRDYLVKYTERGKKGMGKILGLCEYYMPFFQEIFTRHGLPQELKAMAIVESALNPTAVSWAGAAGMWQFMPSAAKGYGLHVDTYVDERLDPIKSGEAAAEFLKDMYQVFGDWNLAIASYNCGPGNIQKAIRRAGSRKFWDIWPYLPTETRGYVPAFVGVTYAMHYRNEYGIEPVHIEMPAQTDTFKINKKLHLKQVCDLTGISLEEIKKFNPQYKLDIIPGNEREYILRLPHKYTDAFVQHEDSVYKHKAKEYFEPLTIKKASEIPDPQPKITYVVKKGDCLGTIADDYKNVTVEKLKQWNNLKSDNLSIGQKLTIYTSGKGPVKKTSTKTSTSKTTSKSSASSSKPKTNTAAKAKLQCYYTVKAGDSFYSIAKNYPGVSAENIMDFNNRNSTNLRPGEKIKIPKY